MNYYNCCINLKKRKNKPFCKLLNKEINFNECKECPNKEYKTKKVKNSFYKSNSHQIRKKSCKTSAFLYRNSAKIKRESNKHRKADKNRFSIIVEDLSKCCVPNCESVSLIHKHEIFYGAYRHVSIKYGLVIPLCPFHHTIGEFAIHNNREMDLYYKRLGQAVFERKYSHELFMREFKIDYLKKYRKEETDD